jgi:hypothetical protein
MTAAKTSGNPPETLSDTELILKHLSHMDEGIHAIERRLDGIAEFIEEHRPALARGLALMDSGAKIRSMLPGGRRRG